MYLVLVKNNKLTTIIENYERFKVNSKQMQRCTASNYSLADIENVFCMSYLCFNFLMLFLPLFALKRAGTKITKTRLVDNNVKSRGFERFVCFASDVESFLIF